MKTSQPFSRRDFLKFSAASLCGACLAACARIPDAPPAEAYVRDNYKKLLTDFDAVLNPVRNLIVELCGEQETTAILKESRATYETLLPQVPYIGGDDNALTEVLYMSAIALAFYRVMLAHGQPVEESGRIFYRAMEALFDNLIDPLDAMLSGDPNGKVAQDEFRRMARWSEKSLYPDDWKLTFMEGTADFDFGVDYTECGLVKFYKAQKATELAPYLCLGDFPQSQLLKTGLVRTTTLARGGPCCDFRFKTGHPIQMEWTPEFLKE
jgi:hypothetical protein